MSNMVILHFAPVELYPPVRNFTKYLEEHIKNDSLTIITTHSTYPGLITFNSDHPKIKIKRFGKSGPGAGKLERIFSYVEFNLVALWFLIRKRPGTVMYYETISSFPAFIFKRFIYPGARIFIHYHEYTSRAEYESGMFLTRLFHRYEKWLYQKSSWVSHTNSQRLKLFLDDVSPARVENVRLLPNYPPASWCRSKKIHGNLPVRIVYIGALSMDTMYTREMAEWVLLQEGNVTWDIYSFNITAEASQFLNSLPAQAVQFKGGVDYTELPRIMEGYDIGVVLYKGHIPNYVFNAPNKLFEYRSAGLQVWVPDVMTGAKEYVDGKSILSICFESMNELDYKTFQLMQNANGDDNKYFCEEVFKPLREELIGKNKNKL